MNRGAVALAAVALAAAGLLVLGAAERRRHTYAMRAWGRFTR